jgi:carbamoyl-phosphate synthase large subunit
MVRLGVQVMLGKTLGDLGYEPGLWPKRRLVAVKAPVFSMSKLVGVDTYLGPEMKSTGEVMGIDRSFPAAMAKAMLASELALPPKGGALLSVSDRTKPDAIPFQTVHEAGYRHLLQPVAAEIRAWPAGRAGE